MKDLQTVEKFQQAQAEKWAKKEKDIHLQVCFKKAVDVEKKSYYKYTLYNEKKRIRNYLRYTKFFFY